MNTEDSEFERIAREQAMREEYKSAIEVSVVFHEGMKMFAVPVQPARQCKWPTCQSEEYQQALAEQIKRELVGEHPAVLAGYERHEYRPYGAPGEVFTVGEVRIYAILASEYKMKDGTIAEDFQWLADSYRDNKNTIKLIPLYTIKETT